MSSGAVASTVERRGSELSNRQHEKLLKWSTKTIKFLNNLTTDQIVDANHVRKAAMPHSAFARAKALEFVFRKKYGFLLSYQYEAGFVTKKLVDEEGNITWSPPIFTKGRSVGVGVTAGRQLSGMCLALMNDEAVTNSTKPHYRMGLKGQFLLDMDGAAVKPVRLDSTSQADNVIVDPRGCMLAKYFRMEAMMVDFSVEGVYINVGNLNKAVYGNDYSIEAVLNGEVEPPSEFVGVLDLLNRLAKSGQSKGKLRK